MYLEEVYIAKRSYEIQVLNTTDEEAKSSDTDIIGVNVEFDIGGKHHVGIVTSVSDGKYHIEDVDTKVVTPLEEGQFFIPQPDNEEEERIIQHRKARPNSISTDIYNNNLTETPAKRLRSSSNASNSSISSSSGGYSRNRESGFSSNVISEEEEMEDNRREIEEEEKEEEENYNNNNDDDDDYLREIDFTSHMDYKFEKPFFYQRWLNYLYNEQRKESKYPLLDNKKCKYCGKEYSNSNNKNKYCWNSNCISSPCFKSKPFISIITINNQPIKKRRIRISSNITSKDSSPNDENSSNTSNSNSGKESDSNNSSFDYADQSYNVNFNLYIHLL